MSLTSIEMLGFERYIFLIEMNKFIQMEDHLIVRVDDTVAPKDVETLGNGSCSHVDDTKEDEEFDVSGEDEPLIQSIECRICQEEDSIKNLEVPCACNGSLKVKFLFNLYS